MQVKSICFEIYFNMPFDVYCPRFQYYFCQSVIAPASWITLFNVVCRLSMYAQFEHYIVLQTSSGCSTITPAGGGANFLMRCILPVMGGNTEFLGCMA